MRRGIISVEKLLLHNHFEFLLLQICHELAQDHHKVGGAAPGEDVGLGHLLATEKLINLCSVLVAWTAALMEPGWPYLNMFVLLFQLKGLVLGHGFIHSKTIAQH